MIGALAERYYQLYRVMGDDWRTEPETVQLSNELAKRLITDKAVKKTTTKTSKRYKNLQHYTPDILEWREHIGLID